MKSVHMQGYNAAGELIRNVMLEGEQHVLLTTFTTYCLAWTNNGVVRIDTAWG